ncbi:hypothetical protein [Phascolarctobacterium succinatutens]|uniref:hypothetical protein n=1 Tax=Phascolarctobacterium succinatutens TaxID=626940 RepID=UPI0026E92DB0|nr:hypothetical protein [Phascolarctobacterium succinatutens]
MIDAEDLPSIELACRLRDRTFSDTCSYCLELADSTLLAQDETWDKLLAAVCAGYVAGVRHERKRQRQKATAGKLPTPQNITGQEMELLQAWRMLDDANRCEPQLYIQNGKILAERRTKKERACRRCHTSTGLHRIIFK